MEFLAHVKLLGYMGFRVPSTSKETRSPEVRSQPGSSFLLDAGKVYSESANEFATIRGYRNCLLTTSGLPSILWNAGLIFL